MSFPAIKPPCDDGFNTDQLAAWSSGISDIFDEAIQRTVNPNDQNPAPEGIKSHFINPTKTKLTDKAVKAVVNWVAFPKLVKLKYPADHTRWKVADESESGRHVQDEYCEWSVTRTAEGKIRKVTFTCEGPEYWEFLAKTDPNKVVQLYQKHISSKVKKSDLFSNGQYVPTNKWNNSTTRGAMHLIQRNNTLSAEIILGGDATVLRKHDGQPVTDQQQLIKCSQYGQAGRNSDPLIGFSVNQLVFKNKAFITFDNPVGLFFHSLDTSGWVTPDRTSAQTFWKYTRGTAERPVRAVFEVPSDKGYVVGDIKINDENIKYGGQIADSIRIKLTAVADRFNEDTPKFFPCVGEEDGAVGRSLAGPSGTDTAKPESKKDTDEEKDSKEIKNKFLTAHFSHSRA